MDLRPSLDPAPTDRHEVVREGVPSPMPADLYKTVFEASFGLSLVADGKGRIRALSDAAADLFPSRRVALGSQVQEAAEEPPSSPDSTASQDSTPVRT